MDTFCYCTYLNGNWYRDQGMTILDVIKLKLKKIWAIIRNKDFYYSDIRMTRKDFEVFREYIDDVDGRKQMLLKLNKAPTFSKYYILGWDSDLLTTVKQD